MPILLTRSVVAQATEYIPSAAAPNILATRRVKMARKFDASIASPLRVAPRFNSAPDVFARGKSCVTAGIRPDAPSSSFNRTPVAQQLEGKENPSSRMLPIDQIQFEIMGLPIDYG